MDFNNDKRQNSRERGSASAGRGEAQAGRGRETESLLAINEHERPANTDRMMEEIAAFVIRPVFGLTISNRRVRTRTHGGVAGVGG